MNKLCQITVLLLAAAMVTTGCAHRKVEEAPQVDPKDEKIENLTTALSRAQSRIEELDAKLSALTDKMESTKVTVDNLAGMKPLKTEAVGSAKSEANEARTKAATPAKQVLSIRLDEASTEFGQAMSLFKAGKYTDAELAFNRFTEKYPEHILAGSAQFFAGESYFMMGEYTLATNEYSKVVSTFATSPRVASAVVRLAQCYDAAGAPKDAQKTMALARDMFDGNPTLELPAPEKPARKMAPAKAAAPAQAAPATGSAETARPAQPAKNELNAGVMEPHSAAPAPAAATDDQKLDEIAH